MVKIINHPFDIDNHCVNRLRSLNFSLLFLLLIFSSVIAHATSVECDRLELIESTEKENDLTEVKLFHNKLNQRDLDTKYKENQLFSYLRQIKAISVYLDVSTPPPRLI